MIKSDFEQRMQKYADEVYGGYEAECFVAGALKARAEDDAEIIALKNEVEKYRQKWLTSSDDAGARGTQIAVLLQDVKLLEAEIENITKDAMYYERKLIQIVEAADAIDVMRKYLRELK